MKAQINRKAFLQASLATTLTGLVGCAGEDGGGDGDMTGDGDGTGGTGDAGTGGGVGSGGGNGSGGTTGTGGDGAATGGTGSGGDAAGTGGTGTGGDGGLMCDMDITAICTGTHTHKATITAAMLNGGISITIDTFDFDGPDAFDHEHSIDLSAEELMIIKNGGAVTKLRCDDHGHEYVFSCDPSAPSPNPDPDPECP